MSESDQLELVLRLGMAVLIGAAVGIEREWRGHEAGLRTSALVCVGSALFGEVSELSGDSRIAAGVVQGIGFLGAGLIFTHGNEVRNATTATTMWVLAGVGLALSHELWIVAILTGVGMIVLLELVPISGWVFERGRQQRLRDGEPMPGDLPDDKGHDGNARDDGRE